MDIKNKVTNLTQNFIQTKSYSGQEKEMIEKLKSIFEEFKFDDYYVDEYGSIVGKVKGSMPGKKILFDCHIDTVEIGDLSKWSKDPLGGEILNGKIYGRGSTDMKGPLAAALVAIENFKTKTNNNFSGEIYISGVVHEECFEGVAARKISEYINPDYVIICEPSGLNLKIGQKGRAEIIFEVIGKPAHSATPDKGINAVYKAMKLIEEIKNIPLAYDNDLGYGILELVDIKSEPYPGESVVPEYCKITYDRRLLVGETKETVLEPINIMIENMKEKDVDFDVRVFYSTGEEECWTGENIIGERFFPAWKYDISEIYISKIYDELSKIDPNIEVTHYPFCTNGSHYAGEVGINTIGYGPSKEELAHTIDEYIEIDQLVKAVEGYELIIKSLL